MLFFFKSYFIFGHVQSLLRHEAFYLWQEAQQLQRTGLVAS